MFPRLLTPPALAIVLLFATAAIQPVPAAAQTVDEIIKRGKVVIAVDTTTPVYGMV